MRLNSPIVNLTAAMEHAMASSLDPFKHFRRDFSREMTDAERLGGAKWPGEVVSSRPAMDQIVVLGMFSQMWGSTAKGLGRKGCIAGAAMTPAYSIALKGPAGDVAVYFDGKFAYRILPNSQDPSIEMTHLQFNHFTRFQEDLLARDFSSVTDSEKRYNAVLTLGSQATVNTASVDDSELGVLPSPRTATTRRHPKSP